MPGEHASLNIAREISQKLEMNYVFGREFQELTQGPRTSPAYHGQATLSPLAADQIPAYFDFAAIELLASALVPSRY